MKMWVYIQGIEGPDQGWFEVIDVANSSAAMLGIEPIGNYEFRFTVDTTKSDLATRIGRVLLHSYAKASVFPVVRTYRTSHILFEYRNCRVTSVSSSATESTVTMSAESAEFKQEAPLLQLAAHAGAQVVKHALQR